MLYILCYYNSHKDLQWDQFTSWATGEMSSAMLLFSWGDGGGRSEGEDEGVTVEVWGWWSLFFIGEDSNGEGETGQFWGTAALRHPQYASKQIQGALPGSKQPPDSWNESCCPLSFETEAHGWVTCWRVILAFLLLFSSSSSSSPSTSSSSLCFLLLLILSSRCQTFFLGYRILSLQEINSWHLFSIRRKQKTEDGTHWVSQQRKSRGSKKGIWDWCQRGRREGGKNEARTIL